MAILWLVSFPKSGNTWMRAFLANYFANGRQPMSLAQLQKTGFSDAHGWPYEKLTGRPFHELSEEEIGKLRPRVQETLARQEARNGFEERSQKAERFFRKGKAGGWRDVLSDAQVQQIIADHGEALEHFGYLAPDGTILAGSKAA